MANYNAGFLNVERYKILAAWDKGVWTEDEWLRDEGVEKMEGKKGGEEEQEMQFMFETGTDVELQKRR